jgi:hypothetical protein
MLYLDTSILLKRYIEEPDSDQAEAYLLADPVWVTARHTRIEVSRNLVRSLDGRAREAALRTFDGDWERMHVVALDDTTCDRASAIAESTGARTLDALHLAAASRVGTAGLSFATFDVRQAQAARALGLLVVGA